MKIVALTSCCVDIYPDLDEIYVGGNSLNFATQCKISGIEDVAIVGAVGEDIHAVRIVEYLNSQGIDRSHLYHLKEPTASNKIYIDKDGDRFFKSDSWNGGAFDVFRLSENDWQFLTTADIIAMPAGDPNLDGLLKRKRDQLVTIDFLDYFPIDFIEQKIRSIDIAFISAKEDMLVYLHKLALRTEKMIVATLGSLGSVAFYQSSRYFQDALQVEKIVDTTGCGDAFQAAFSIEWYKSRDIQKALYHGSFAAKNVLGFKGSVQQS